MKQTQEPEKRVVSKGQYALAQGIRVGQAAWGSIAILFGVFIGFSAITGTALVIFPMLKELVELHEVVMHLIAISIFLGSGIVLAYLAVESLHTGFTGIKEAAKNEVVPLTRANAADLPANDTLVRAASEPVQAQAASLLRGAAPLQEQHEEQLLRAAE